MVTKGNPGDNKNNRSSLSIFIIVGLCGFFYILGLWQRSGFGKGDSIAVEITKRTDCIVLSDLNYETHHDDNSGTPNGFGAQVKEFKPCDDRYIDYTPCHDQARAMTFPRDNMAYRERHCPPDEEKLFPGGGTQFPKGADAYIDELASVIPLDNGMVRTALDPGCGVASFGAYLFKKNVVAMSIAPRDSHEAQVQFALERGVPAIIGVLGTIMLPFPSGAFDMAHCSRCLIQWGANDGKYMKEVDRVLRPGGYWILSGPPINWKNSFQAWQRPEDELEEEQRQIEDTAKLLCWEKKYEKGEIAIWRKKLHNDDCSEQDTQPTICETTNSDDVWYKKMEDCVTPSKSSGPWKPFQETINVVPFRIISGFVPGVSVKAFEEDNRLWKKHVNAYKRINKIISSGRYRNIMDMNAGLGSFAAALESPKLCEAFSTYPRTYDLIHANGVFSLYKNVCNAEDILLEMDRILRPEGAVIFRDQANMLMQVKRTVKGMRWNTKMVDHEDGPLVSEKVLFAVKQYWVVGDNTMSSV
ncbi:Putative methyltransferase PMT2 [Glycine soja]|uniref:Methyltransferase n=1 Tax=Glycine soja TaxID=3848 RepID=A0A0B2REQ6_GLYSO|nr:Putative methyltransferase PMT2 [Glycine soja]